MHRFYLAPEHCSGTVLVLADREAYHALQVLRLGRGDPVIVLDGAGLECRCEITECRKKQVFLRVLEKRRVPPLPWQTTLLQALPKGKLFEAIVQKATELGAGRIVPITSERVVKELKGDHAVDTAAKWQLVAIEAIKQCGSAWLPKVELPLSPEEFLARKEVFDLGMVGSLQSGSRHPRACFHDFQCQHRRAPVSIGVWVGPEGDFSPAELQMIVSAGTCPITLGRLVLRAETAAIYCLSVINYEMQARSGPEISAAD